MLLEGVLPAEVDPRGPAEAASYAPDRIIVRYRDEVSARSGPHPSGLAPGRRLSEAAGLRIVGVDASGVPAALEAARKDPRVLYAEPDYVIGAGTSPDDPRFGELWGLRNVGQGSGTVGADIGAMTAWQQSTGSDGVVVAVLDSGVDYAHPDLSSNLWTNPGEIPGNNLDDDGNGYVDDVRGWDFVNRDNNPMDDNSHGTHVAGTIGARGNNQVGVTGVSWDVSIMPLKVLDRFGNGTVSAAIDAINYAWRNGAVISNASWGGTTYSQSLRDAINAAGAQADHLFVAAAGNQGTIMDAPGAAKFYPAAFDLPNIVSVAASDRNDQLAGFSNSGWLSVDLAAPGVDILSTTPGGGYGLKSGTSMAAPHVAGAAALLKAEDPSLGAEEIKSVLMASVEPTGQLGSLTAGGGRLDLASAMQIAADEPHLRTGVVELTGLGQWETVSLDRRYASMVVAATPEIPIGGLSLVPRIRNVGDDRFEISVESAASPREDALLGGGFEAPEAGAAGSHGSFLYRPAGSPWSYSGDAGVTADGSGFTAANPPAPEGDQVAFLQRNGRISQDVQVAEPGTYRLRLKAAHRANSRLQGHDFAVTVGGVEVARFAPSDDAYRTFEATFALPAGASRVALVGLNTLGGDRTSLIDDVSLERVDESQPISLGGSGFEAPEAGAAGSHGSFLYRPAGSPWSYSGDAGVTADGSGFTAANPPAPEGDQVAFLQRNGRISQDVQVAEPGTYRLRLKAAHRANSRLQGHDFAVTVGGVEVARFAPSDDAYRTFEATFALPAGPSRLSLVGLNTLGGDRTSLIDDISLERIESVPTSLGGSGFEAPEAGAAGSHGSFLYRPAGSPWSYSGDAGVTADGSGFTAANPPAPEGDQVAFLQRNGRISQDVQVAEPGTYRLRLKAAHRANSRLQGHDFAVTVGGVEVARFAPSDDAYRTFEATFALPAGASRVALVGLNTLGGDRTSLIDDVSLERVDESQPISGSIRVHYLVSEEGTFSDEHSGMKMEVRKVAIDAADGGGSFEGLPLEYAQSYEMPVVIGQVMSTNDPRPSMFWASGASPNVAPSPTDLTVGMHVGEDPATSRAPETIGYFVFEAGAHSVDGVDFVAGRTGESVEGLDDSSPFIAPLEGLSSASSAVLSPSSMNDADGAWAALYGDDPVRPDSLQLAAVEDQWRDGERSHGAESVSYVVFGQASGITSFGGRPAIPGLDRIEPRITITRTSGTEPFVVQVSAAETTTGAGNPFTDLEYTWDFGDPGGQELFVHPVSGALIDANTGQEGPEAAYVYRAPGSYSITLTVRGKDESGELITASTSTLMRSAEQEVRVRHASGGTFRLTASVDGGPGRTTAPIRYDAGPDAVVQALAALPNIGAGNLRTGAFLGPEAAGDLLGHRLTLTADASGLVGASVRPEVLILDRIEGGTDEQVTVSAWSGPVIYFDSNYDGISRGVPDGSEAAPFNTFDRLDATLTSGESMRVLIKRGSLFERTSTIQITEAGDGPVRIGSYGDPGLPKPIISTRETPIAIRASRASRAEDIVIDGLDLRSAVGRAFHVSRLGGEGDEYAQANNIHLLETSFYSGNTTNSFMPLIEIFAHTPTAGADARGYGFVFWNCSYDWEALSGSATYQSGLDLDATKWVSVLGGTMASGGAGPSAVPYHSHYVYANVFDHLLLRWMRFDEADGVVNFAVKLRQEAGSPNQVHSRTLIDGVDFGGPANGLSFNQERTGSTFGTVLVQDSAFHVGGEDGFQAMGVYGDNLRRLVIRDSEFFDNGRRGVLILGSVEGLSMGFYRNNVYVPPVTTETNGLTIDARLGPSEFLENTIVAQGSWDPFYNMGIRLRPSLMANWTVDRNQYWAPNNNGIFAAGEGVFYNLASWRATGRDANGTYADPGWINPADGDFRRRR
ncbi:S8 family serine peptidase [Tautonia plasticadhaerens]|nr:S8 family serine peptidase [Tautonia plasticadhaerens]